MQKKRANINDWTALMLKVPFQINFILAEGRVKDDEIGIKNEIGQIFINGMIDKNGFKALFNEYYESIRLYIYYKIAEKDAADDMAQDVFMAVWEKRKGLDQRNVKALLYKIAAGLVVDYYRKCDIKADFSQWVRMNGSEDTLSTNEQAEYNETMQRYAEALNSMSEGQREVFLMNREEELTYREIADRLDLSVKAVEKRMSAALKVLNDKKLTL